MVTSAILSAQYYLIIMGAPGAGKGTVSRSLAQQYPDFKHFSLGDYLRDLSTAKQPSALESTIQNFLKKGQLLPDMMIFQLLQAVLPTWTARVVIWDGFPRNTAQATWLQTYCQTHQRVLLPIVWLQIDSNTAQKRVTQRRICTRCHWSPLADGSLVTDQCATCAGPLATRTDDQLIIWQRRWDIYQQKTLVLQSFWAQHHQLVTIAAGQPLPDIMQQLTNRVLSQARVY